MLWDPGQAPSEHDQVYYKVDQYATHQLDLHLPIGDSPQELQSHVIVVSLVKFALCSCSAATIMFHVSGPCQASSVLSRSCIHSYSYFSKIQVVQADVQPLLTCLPDCAHMLCHVPRTTSFLF